MYLWKCWRDTRAVLGVSLLLIGILFVFVLRQNIVLDHHAPFEKIPLIFPFLLTLSRLVLLPGFWAPSALAGISAIGAGRTYLPGRGAVHTLYGATGGPVWRNWCRSWCC
jgi:hypothetical protein